MIKNLILFSILSLLHVEVRCNLHLTKSKSSPFKPAVLSSSPVFRSDYGTVQEHSMFMKIHSRERSWADARNYCTYEGASLAVLANEAEAKDVRRMLQHQLVLEKRAAWVGAHDLFAEGEYVTIDGDPLAKMYTKWAPGEPNNARDDEDCVSITRDGLLADENCSKLLPFICKKNFIGLTINPECGTYDLSYRMLPDIGECIKLHRSPKSWAEAYLICKAEQSQMAIITSSEKASALTNELANYPKESLKGKFRKDIALLGFHDKFTNGDFLTIEGKTLTESGYDLWAPNQPDNANGHEHCGSMKRSGLLDDVDCSVRAMFFCERVSNGNNSAIYEAYMQNVE